MDSTNQAETDIKEMYKAISEICDRFYTVKIAQRDQEIESQRVMIKYLENQVECLRRSNIISQRLLIEERDKERVLNENLDCKINQKATEIESLKCQLDCFRRSNIILSTIIGVKK